MKLLGVLLTVGACLEIGLSMVSSVKKRIESMSCFIIALDAIRADVVFRKTPVRSMIQEACDATRGPVRSFFQLAGSKMDSGMTFHVAVQECSEALKNTGLSQDEQAKIMKALSIVGKYSQQEQADKLKGFIADLEEDKRRLGTMIEKNGRLYAALGLTSGIILAMAVI